MYSLQIQCVTEILKSTLPLFLAASSATLSTPLNPLLKKKKAEETQLFDSHAPRRWRVMGTLSNSDGFQKAFQCPKGSVMNRGADRCQLW